MVIKEDEYAHWFQLNESKNSGDCMVMVFVGVGRENHPRFKVLNSFVVKIKIVIFSGFALTFYHNVVYLIITF